MGVHEQNDYETKAGITIQYDLLIYEQLSIWITCERFQMFKMCHVYHDQQVISRLCFRSQTTDHLPYMPTEIYMGL